MQRPKALAFGPTWPNSSNWSAPTASQRGLPTNSGWGEDIFKLIAPNLRFFVFSAIRPPVADDVFQEVLKTIATGMKKFEDGSDKEF